MYVLPPRFDPAGFRNAFLLGKRRRDVFFFPARVDVLFSFDGHSVLATALSTNGDWAALVFSVLVLFFVDEVGGRFSTSSFSLFATDAS